MNSAWTCPECEFPGVSINDQRRAGLYEEPHDADVVCSSCDARPSEAVRTRLLLERIASAQAVPPASTERRPPSSTALGVNATARRLRRSKATVAKMIADGALKTIPWPGKKTKLLVPIAEIERIEREGLARPEPAPAPPKRKRRNGAATKRDEREAAVARILAVED
jgi:hypothetical protein